MITHVDEEGEKEDRTEIESQIKQLSMTTAPASPAVKGSSSGSDNADNNNSSSSRSTQKSSQSTLLTENTEGTSTNTNTNDKDINNNRTDVERSTAEDANKDTNGTALVPTVSTKGTIPVSIPIPPPSVPSSPLKPTATKTIQAQPITPTNQTTTSSSSTTTNNNINSAVPTTPTTNAKPKPEPKSKPNEGSGGDMIDNMFIMAMAVVAFLIAYLVARKMLHAS